MASGGNPDPILGMVGVGLNAFSGLFSAGMSIAQGNSTANYYNFLAQQSEANIQFQKETEKMQATAIGNQAANQGAILAKQQNQFNAASTAQAAAQGIAGSVSQQDVMQSNLTQERLDELAIRYNADQAILSSRLQSKTAILQQQQQRDAHKAAAANASAEGWINGITKLISTGADVATQVADGQQRGLWNTPLARTPELTGEGTRISGFNTHTGETEALTTPVGTNMSFSDVTSNAAKPTSFFFNNYRPVQKSDGLSSEYFR